MKSTIEHIAQEFISEAKASPRMFEDLAAMEKYMAESYDGRAFVEMLQNADDALSTKVEVFSCGDDFVVANNGRAFNESDILSICRSGASSKQRGNGIGYRGVGFKSATSISTEIIICSADEYFTFSKSQCAKRLGKELSQVPTVRIPFPVSSATLSYELNEEIKQHKALGYSTFFIFKSANKEKFCDELGDVNSGWLLFLNHIVEIRIKTGKINTSYRVNRTQRCEQQTIVKLLNSDEQWLCVSDGCGVSIAFRYDAGILPCQPEEALFHCYLPTLDSFGFPFKANADFSTDPSRKHVIISDEITQKNLTQIASLICSFITNSRSDYDGATVINLLSSRVGLSEAAAFLEKKVLSFLNEDSWLPLNSGKCITPKNYRVMPDWVDAKSQKLIYSNVPSLLKYELNEEFARKAEKINTILLKTGASYYALNEYVEILSNASLIAKISMKLLGKFWGYAFRSACYNIEPLNNCYFQNAEKLLITVKESSETTTLTEDFLKSVEGVLSSDEMDKLIGDVPAFSILKSSKINKNNTQSAVRREINSSSGLSKWKTPIQNCISAEAQNGCSGKDVSRKQLGYDVASTNVNGETKYISVKEVNALGDSFVLSEKELSVAQTQPTSYYVFLIAKDDPENQHLLISDIASLSLDKRVREWEYIFANYKVIKQEFVKEYPIDSKFLNQFSLKYLNKIQTELLIAICNGSDLTELESTYSCKVSVVSTQINSIVDFYTGNSLLIVTPEGKTEINDKYYGSIRYMLKEWITSD